MVIQRPNIDLSSSGDGHTSEQLSWQSRSSPSLRCLPPKATQALEAPLEACRGRGDPAAGVKEPECVAFVSKMVALSRGDLPELKRRAASLSAKEQQQK